MMVNTVAQFVAQLLRPVKSSQTLRYRKCEYPDYRFYFRKLYREGSTFLETNNYTCLTITSTALQNEGQVNGATAIA